MFLIVILTVDGVGVAREVRTALYLREALPDSVRHCLVPGQVLFVAVQTKALHAALEPFYLRHLQQTKQACLLLDTAPLFTSRQLNFISKI